MRIGITSDHAAHDLRINLIPCLRELGYDVVDRRPTTSERTDYAKWGVQLAREVTATRFDVGTMICGSGIGISIAANKIKGIRAACVSEVYSAAVSQCYNNTNVPCFGSRVVGPDVALAICEAFLGASFEGRRHAGRVAQFRQPDVGDMSFLDEGYWKGLGYGLEFDFRGWADSITRVCTRVVNLGAGPLV